MFYSCRSIPDGYRMVKFDDHFFVESVYAMPEHNGIVGCSCFQAKRETCRHRQMLENFILTGRVDKGWFWDWENERWIEPICERDLVEFEEPQNDRDYQHLRDL